MTAYDIYVQWCRERERKPPTRAWWDKACGNNPLFQRAIIAAADLERRLDNREIEREHGKDWPDA